MIALRNAVRAFIDLALPPHVNGSCYFYDQCWCEQVAWYWRVWDRYLVPLYRSLAPAAARQQSEPGAVGENV